MIEHRVTPWKEVKPPKPRRPRGRPKREGPPPDRKEYFKARYRGRVIPKVRVPVVVVVMLLRLVGEKRS